MITREFNLYLHAGHSIPLVINANQYDYGEQWLFTLFNSDGTQYVPSSGAIVGIKSDNLGIINTGSVDSQGRVVINETQQMTAAVGKAVFELVIDEGTHGTANFVVLVEPKPGDNADLSETDISMIEQAIEAASTIKPYGSPLVASTVAGMTDHDKVYVYVGSETGYTSGNWYYWDGTAWTSGGVYNSVAVQTDTTLALSGVAADAKKVGDEISDLKSQIGSLSDLETTVKTDLVSAINEANQHGGGGGGSLSTLSDVTLSNLSNGQAITYDSNTGKWKNVTLSGGGSVQIDSALSSTSENPVQNKVINTALNAKADASAVPTFNFNTDSSGTMMQVTLNGVMKQFPDENQAETMMGDYVAKNSVKSAVTAGNTDPVNSVAVIAYINSLDASNYSY